MDQAGNPVAGPPIIEDEPEEKAQRTQEGAYRAFIAQQMANEQKLDFAPGTPGVRAKHDTDFILPDAFTTIGPKPIDHGNQFHGQFSRAMIGSAVPGFADPRARSVGLSNISDLYPSSINKRASTMQMVPHRADLGDGLSNQKLLSAFRRMVQEGKQTDKDIDARQLDSFRRGWRQVGKIGQTF